VKSRTSRYVHVLWYRLSKSKSDLFNQNNVQSTQEIVELILDSNRNTLLALDLKVRFSLVVLSDVLNSWQVSMATFGVGVGTLVAGVFGMNVRSLSLSLALPRSLCAVDKSFRRPRVRVLRDDWFLICCRSRSHRHWPSHADEDSESGSREQQWETRSESVKKEKRERMVAIAIEEAREHVNRMDKKTPPLAL